MKPLFGKYGPKHDYRGAHVVFEYRGRNFLGTIKDIYYDDVTSCIRARVDHFCGEEWPFRPPLRNLEILERSFERVSS